LIISAELKTGFTIATYIWIYKMVLNMGRFRGQVGYAYAPEYAPRNAKSRPLLWRFAGLYVYSHCISSHGSTASSQILLGEMWSKRRWL